MAENATMARPYASAAFDVAKGSQELGRWSRALGFLAAACDQASVRELFESPNFDAPVKAQKLIDVVADELDDRTRRFVQVLASNKRLALLPEISTQFEILRAAEEQQIDVHVTSAQALTPEQELLLSEALYRKFQRKINMTHDVDAELLGGAVIRAGDTVIDGSLSGRLRKLAETVLN
ncbi:MAG: F0F1 ATP synthase subunit delta [Pseudomonadota bacterium]